MTTELSPPPPTVDVPAPASATGAPRAAILKRVNVVRDILPLGALLALDHPAKFLVMQARLDETLRRGGTVCIPVGAIAQALRSPRQARLARLLKSRDVDIAVMTPNGTATNICQP